MSKIILTNYAEILICSARQRLSFYYFLSSITLHILDKISHRRTARSDTHTMLQCKLFGGTKTYPKCGIKLSKSLPQTLETGQ